MDLIPDQLFVCRVVALEIEERGIVFGAVERAEGANRDKFAAPLAVLDDAADTEGVVEDLDGVTDVIAVIPAGSVVVDDDVVWPLEGRAREKLERSQGVVAVVVDAPDGFNRSHGAHLGDHRGDDGDVRQPAEDIRDLGGDRCAADGSEET